MGSANERKHFYATPLISWAHSQNDRWVIESAGWSHHLLGNGQSTAIDSPGPVFCLLLRVSSDYAHPITGQVTEVTCPVIGQAQPELTRSKRWKTGPDHEWNICLRNAAWGPSDLDNKSCLRNLHVDKWWIDTRISIEFWMCNFRTHFKRLISARYPVKNDPVWTPKTHFDDKSAMVQIKG